MKKKYNMLNRQQKKEIKKIALSLIIMIVSLIFFKDGSPVKIVLFFISYLIAGYDIIFEAGKGIAHHEFLDENFLMSLATIGALFLQQYPEAISVMVFYKVGELFQDIAVEKSKKSISELMNIKPTSACVLRNGYQIYTTPEEVALGETIIVKPGQKIPLDGMVEEGSTSIDTSALTGESNPVDVSIGENVLSGSINLTTAIKVKVTNLYKDSTVAKILDLVENNADKKAKTENFITRFAKIYTPCVVSGAVILAVLPSLITGQWNVWLERALIFLVVSCPCALVVSVPLTFFGGLGGASKNGILIKGANYLEVISNADTIVFDKTGTLTKGTFSVTAIHPTCISEQELLDIAALAESYSMHPIAGSIVRAHEGHIDKTRISKIEELSGYGINAVIDGKNVRAGNSKLMKKENIDYHDCTLEGTIVHISINGTYCGHIVISDTVKADSAYTISQLKKYGIRKTVMLTGDKDSVAQNIGKQLGIDEIHSELLPGDKVSIIENIIADHKGKKGTVGFVGDGINDSPVLTRADIGIAMGGMGSDAAIEAADVVLMDDKPSKVVKAIMLAKRTMSIAKQNIIFALVIKAVILLLGALGLANMWLAVFADVGVTVICVLNATRALNIKTENNIYNETGEPINVEA
jgi:Cd2+/Zn2+-exporting ATPase